VDLLRFCEINYLNGILRISNGKRSGLFEYLRGELQKVVLEELPEDQALDEMLSWEEGTFTIEPAPIKLNSTAKPALKNNSTDIVVHLNPNHIVQRLLTKALSQHNWQMLTATTASEALEMLAQHPGAVLLTTAKPPDISLENFITSLRRITATPAVILTVDEQIAGLKDRLGLQPGIYFTQSPQIEDVIAALEPLRSSRAV
jgi:PleD family two-component response regulator